MRGLEGELVTFQLVRLLEDQPAESPHDSPLPIGPSNPERTPESSSDLERTVETLYPFSVNQTSGAGAFRH